MVPGTGSGSPLSAVQAASPDDAGSAERWRQWQLRNAEINRKDVRRMRIVFAAVFAVLGIGLGIQLLAPSLLP